MTARSSLPPKKQAQPNRRSRPKPPSGFEFFSLPAHSFAVETDLEEEDAWSAEDEKFDQIFPASIRKLSPLQWTPVRVAAEAAQLLVTRSGTRVLDIGCGPGKFCLIGAARTEGHFTGIEQRADLVAVGRQAASAMRLSNLEIWNGNIIDIDFAAFEAFYLFNPFEENLANGYKIDSAIPLSPLLFSRYKNYVASQLGSMPLGTRVVTYAGYADEIPNCYECEMTLFDDDLKLWVKTKSYDFALDRLGLGPSRSYRGGAGWVSPRRNR